MQDIGRMGFSEAQGDLLESATAFCRDVSPVSKVRALITDEVGHDPAVWAQIGELGWLAIAIPEAYGGLGLDLGDVVPVVEQMGRRLLADPFVPTTLAAQALIAGGTEAQKEAILPLIAAGAPAALALMEAAGDWNLEAVTATARSDGASGLILSGTKILVEAAAAADWIIASVLHEGAPALVLIEASELPFGALRREAIVDETRRAFSLCLDGIALPEAHLLDQTRAAATLAHLHLASNLLACAEMCGGTQAAIDDTVDYAKTRVQFGKPIGAYQAVKHPIVDAYVRYEQARSHLYSAAHCFNEQGTGEIAVRMAKAEADAAFSFAADRAIQFHGGFGFTYDCDAQLYRRRAIWCAAQHGDRAFHKKKLAELLF